MRPEVAKSLGISSERFLRLVWPVIAPACGGGEMLPVEGVTEDKMCKALDVLAGIDGWQILHREGAVRGVAVRVQETTAPRRPWDTFTIRYALARGGSTEWHKRLLAIRQPQRGLLSPAYVVQAYVSVPAPERLLSAAACLTADLFDVALRHEALARSRRFAGSARLNDPAWINVNRADGNEFFVVPWRTLIAEGARVVRAPTASDSEAA